MYMLLCQNLTRVSMSNVPIKHLDFDVRTIHMDKHAHDKYILWLMHRMGSFGFKIFIVSILFMYLCQKLTRVAMSILYLTPIYMSILDTSIYANCWHIFISVLSATHIQKLMVLSS